jgi:hypothetical protein
LNFQEEIGEREDDEAGVWMNFQKLEFSRRGKRREGMMKLE